MSNPNSANVTVGKPSAAGGIFSAPITAAAPTDATAPLAEDFIGLGYVSEDGLTNTVEADTESVTAWGGDNVLTITTSRNETFTWSFIETNADVLKEVYGQENVTDEGGAISVLHKNTPLPRRSYAFEILLSGDRVKRIYVPNAQITEIGDVVYVDGEAVAYEVTLSCYPDSQGVTVYEYIASTTAAG